jgi:hypothetical protein
MESILIHPENVEQLKMVKAFLTALDIQFEIQSDILLEHVLKSIERSMQQHENGETISLEEFREKHL